MTGRIPPGGFERLFAGARTGGGYGLGAHGLQAGKGQTAALPCLSRAYFRRAVKAKPYGRASAAWTGKRTAKTEAKYIDIREGKKGYVETRNYVDDSQQICLPSHHIC